MNYLLSFSLKLHQTPSQNHAQSDLIWNEQQAKHDLEYCYSGSVFIGFPTCFCVFGQDTFERESTKRAAIIGSCVDGLIHKSLQD